MHERSLSGRLSLWQAGLCVLVGGFFAQLAGASAANVAGSWLRARGAAPEALESSAWVIVPALVTSTGCLIAIAVLVPALLGLPIRAALGLHGARPSSFVAAGIGTVMLGPSGDVLMRGMQALAPDWSLGVVPMLNDLVRSMPWLVAWSVLALLPGVSEELIFRGFLQRSARSRRVGILVSGLAFGLFHVDPHHVAGVLPLGFFLAWVASRCGTLVTVVAHIANNSMAIVAVHSSSLDVGYGTDTPMPWYFLPVSLVFTALSAWIIVRDTSPPEAGQANAFPSE